MKISLIGLGRVGSTLAYTLVQRGLCDELVLYNRRPEVALGDAYDLEHAASFTPWFIRIRAGDLEQTAESDLLLFCASATLPAGATDRRLLGPVNVGIMESLIPRLARLSPRACLLVLSNPVDVLVWHALRLSGFPPERVMGTGTLVDSARYRSMLSTAVDIHPDDVRAYILGEHGEAQFPVSAMAQAGGESLADQAVTRQAYDQVLQAGYRVLQNKGYTNFAVAMATALIVQAIVEDSRRTIPVSIRLQDYFGLSDVCLSIPAVIGQGGVRRVLKPTLSPDEQRRLRAAADIVREQSRLAGIQPRDEPV